MALLEQWREIQAQLPERWATARLSLVIEDEADCDRAAFLLGPVNPGRRGKQIRFRLGRGGTGPSANLVGRLLARLDAERVDGRVELLGAEVLLGERLPLLQLGHAVSLETPCRMLRPWRSSRIGGRSRRSFRSAGRPRA